MRPSERSALLGPGERNFGPHELLEVELGRVEPRDDIALQVGSEECEPQDLALVGRLRCRSNRWALSDQMHRLVRI